MGDANPIRTLGYYSKHSHEGYMNSIELPLGNNAVPLRSDTIRWCKTDAHSTDFGLVSNFMASQDARLSKFEVDFKQQQSEMTNKIDTVLKAITDRMAGALPSDTVKNSKLNASPVSLGDSKLFDTLADLGSCVNIISLYLFKKLNIELLEETDHIFGLADGTKSYPVGIVKDVEVHIGKLKLLKQFLHCRKAKIAVGEGITRSVFRVKGVDLGKEEAPYWTRLGKRESYKPRPSSDGIGAQTSYYARKDFLDCHFPREWEIARDAEINPFKDVLVFRRMVEFLGDLPINLKGNMWESEDSIENPINWDKPPKDGDGA
ncbi:MAK10-like protein [Tanacetum coccineum]